ncbi:peptidase M14 carboxypeptidase A [Caldalkalibacillus thermarum TA2.A1]|uniref:Peptidase M14 carboxypeptidase A n=1 Tax=Caldalkalibacillus thermarum (strain TA2.A1) TaxID=986075 RepID=F5LB59_CALTT|nr:peptidase M14 carboxypeptidase A [Caldalkalibacillus thermarum TA2.A1]GGK33587.1 hypothetical protein GCM10010965_28090 [Caldalkalibacillus thermarum]
MTSNARNHFAVNYNIATLLVEMRGLTHSPYYTSILGQKGNGYQIDQGIVIMKSVIAAIADRSIHEADISFWDTLPYQYRLEHGK